MPAFIWPIPPVSAAATFDRRSTDASSCLIFASEAVDGLHYLSDIDNSLPGDAVLDGNHKATIAHVTHARWAAGTAMTALDLCAACIGFLHLPAPRNRRFYDIGRLTQEQQKPQDQRRFDLANVPGALAWLNGVTSDGDYTLVQEVRDLLTHRSTARHFYVGVGGPTQTADPTGLPCPVWRTRLTPPRSSAPQGSWRRNRLCGSSAKSRQARSDHSDGPPAPASRLSYWRCYSGSGFNALLDVRTGNSHDVGSGYC